MNPFIDFMHVIFLHSTGGSPKEAFLPWLRHQLETLGHEVSAPEFPNSIEPNPKVAVPLVSELYIPSKDTIFVGRSSGGTLIPHVLEQEEIHAKAAFSIAAPYDDLGWENLQILFRDQPDFSRAKASVDHYFHWYSDDDPYVPLEHSQQFKKHLGGEIRVFSGYSHFYNEEFPELLEEIQKFA